MNQITLFYAQVAAAYFMVTGLGFLISTDFYDKMVQGTGSTDPVSLNLSGEAHFLIGFSILIQHFRWGNLLEILVTLIGIAITTKGIGLIAIPEVMLRSPKTSRQALKLSGVGFITLGICLGYLSYF